MEPMNFTADVRKDSCLVYGPTQFQQLAAGVAAQVTGLKPEQITVRTTFLGGGFGRRIDVDFIAPGGGDLQGGRRAGQAGVDARRRHDPRLLPARRATTSCRAALDAQGKPVALKFHLTSPSVTVAPVPAAWSRTASTRS